MVLDLLTDNDIKIKDVTSSVDKPKPHLVGIENDLSPTTLNSISDYLRFMQSQSSDTAFLEQAAYAKIGLPSLVEDPSIKKATAEAINPELRRTTKSNYIDPVDAMSAVVAIFKAKILAPGTYQDRVSDPELEEGLD